MLSKLIGLMIAVFFVSGCTTGMQDGTFRLNDYIKVYMVMKPHERLLENAFDSSSHSFHQSEEEIAHKSLTEDEIGTGQRWKNDTYGELFFVPGKYQQHNGKQCREFRIEWVTTQTGVFKHKENGQACLNTKTKLWEWAVY